MGCAQSKIDNEEVVARSKDRRNLMKDAVIARNVFAVGHSGYSFALKNVGAALSDFGYGEAENNEEQLQQPPDHRPPPSSIDSLPPPPPPLPNFSPSPIKRAVSMPAISLKDRKHLQEFDKITIMEDEEDEDDDDEKDDDEEIEEGNRNEKHKNKKVMGGSHGEMASASISSARPPEMRPLPNSAWDYFFMVDEHLAGPSLNTEEEEEEEEEELPHPQNNNAVVTEESVNVINYNNIIDKNNNVINNNDDFNNNVGDGDGDGDVNVIETRKADDKVIEHARTAPPEFVSRASTVSLMRVLNQIDDHFLKASQSAIEVSNILEATKLHYHSNFADNRGNYSILFHIMAGFGDLFVCLLGA